jgi:hypothetical protein
MPMPNAAFLRLDTSCLKSGRNYTSSRIEELWPKRPGARNELKNFLRTLNRPRLRSSSGEDRFLSARGRTVRNSTSGRSPPPIS